MDMTTTTVPSTVDYSLSNSQAVAVIRTARAASVTTLMEIKRGCRQ